MSAPALADLKSDGKLAIGAAAHRGGFRCFDAVTGVTRWSLPTAQTATDPAAADIDGDGREEFIFGVGKELWAVGEADRKTRVVWKLVLTAVIHPPIAADMNGDGRLDILCLATDGFLYAAGSATNL